MYIRRFSLFDITNLLGFWGNQDFSWSVRGNNPPVCSNTKSDREREGETGRGRERGRLSPQAKLTQTDNFKVKTVVYLVKGEKGWGRKERKIYLICNCQESIFTCKIAGE